MSKGARADMLWLFCWTMGSVCVCVFTHTCARHEEAEGKGPARDELVGLDQEGGLVCHAKELGVYPKATGSY